MELGMDLVISWALSGSGEKLPSPDCSGMRAWQFCSNSVHSSWEALVNVNVATPRRAQWQQ